MTSVVPDLGSPLPGAPGVAYQAFDRPGLVIAVPDRLSLERDRHGAPQLLLALVRQPGGEFVGGRLELGLAAEADLAGIAGALAAAQERANVTLADVRYAAVLVSTNLGPLGATPLAPPQVLTGESLGIVRAVLTLDAGSAAVAARLIADATLPVNATLHVVFLAVAPRIPLVLTYEPRALLQRLTARFGEQRGVSASDLGRAIDELLGTAEIVADGDFQNLDPALRTTTLGLRLGRRLATRNPANPAVLELERPDAAAQGRERLDLAAPETVETDLALSMDPLSTARAMHGDDLEDLVRRLEIEPLATGRIRVTVTANLPERIAGLQALVGDLRAPEQPPFRPVAETASVSLGEPHRSGDTELRLASGEPLSLEARLRAVIDLGGMATALEGPWRDVDHHEVLLGVQDFPVPLLFVRASASLMEVAVVDIIAGTVVRLDVERASAAVPLADASRAPEIVVRPLGRGREIRIDPGAARRIDLDPATLPGFGVHRARFTTSETKPFIVEWGPDADTPAPASSLRMGADRLSADVAWVAASAFRPGLVWRTVRDGVGTPWSTPVMPTDDLLIRIGGGTPMNDQQDPLVIDGITLHRKSGDSSTWTYVPRAPTLDLDAGGKPMLKIVEAGGVAFLQCSARVALRDGERAALLRKLQAIRPEAQAVEAAALTARRIALECFTGGAWLTASESTGSGLPPWTAALSAMLTAEALGALRAAVEGESGRARLTASITLAGTQATVHRSHEAGSARVRTSAGETASSYTVVTDASSAARAPVPLELTADIADLLREAPAHD